MPLQKADDDGEQRLQVGVVEMLTERVVHAREPVAYVVQGVEGRGVVTLQRIAAGREKVIIGIGQHRPKQDGREQQGHQGHAAHAQPVCFAKK